MYGRSSMCAYIRYAIIHACTLCANYWFTSIHPYTSTFASCAATYKHKLENSILWLWPKPVLHERHITWNKHEVFHARTPVSGTRHRAQVSSEGAIEHHSYRISAWEKDKTCLFHQQRPHSHSFHSMDTHIHRHVHLLLHIVCVQFKPTRGV